MPLVCPRISNYFEFVVCNPCCMIVICLKFNYFAIPICLICNFIQQGFATRRLIHLIYRFSFHMYVTMCLFDVLVALDVQKIEKNEYFCIFFKLPIYCRCLPTFSPINPIISFWTLGDIFADTIFVTLIKTDHGPKTKYSYPKHLTHETFAKICLSRSIKILTYIQSYPIYRLQYTVHIPKYQIQIQNH